MLSMELQEELIIQAFKKIDDSPSNIELDKILNGLNEYKLEDLISNQENVSLNLYYNKLHGITNKYLHGFFANYQTHISEFAGILSSARKFLVNAIDDGDVKSLLIFLTVNCYLKISISRFYGKKLNKKKKQKLSKNITTLLKALQIKIDVPIKASYYEHELKIKADEGFKEENIEKLYDFVLAVERGGRGFHFSFLLENIIAFLYQLDIKALVSQLNKLERPETNIFYLQSFLKIDLIEISKNEIENKWVLFELIRQIIDKEKRDADILIEDKSAIVICLQKLHLIAPAIYRQSIPFFHKSKLFNIALGKQICELENSEMLAAFKLLPIDKYDHNLLARTGLLEELRVHADDSNYLQVLHTAHESWQNLFDSIYKSDDFINNLFLTSHANFIIHYYNNEKDSEQLIELMVALLEKLIWINSEWFVSESQQIKAFYLYFSHAYLISFAFRNKQLKELRVPLLIDQLKASETFSLRKITNNGISHLDTIFNNINWSIHKQASND